MGCKDPLYLQLCADMWVNSKANGSARTWVITPPERWPLGLGLQSFLVGMRITTPDATARINIRWEYSIDGCSMWTQRSSALISNATTAGDYTGSLLRSATPTEFTPYVRIVAVVDDSGAAAEMGMFISAWGYYQYNC